MPQSATFFSRQPSCSHPMLAYRIPNARHPHISLYAPLRAYATRRPVRPPQKIRDPLHSPHATHYQVEPSSTEVQSSKKLTFIHKPPPSAPVPFSLTTAPASPLLAPASSTSPTADLPPLLWPEDTTHATLSESQIDQIRALRNKDPERYTASSLARQFNCSSKFVGLVAPLSKTLKEDRLRAREEEHDAARSTWGQRRQLVKEIRAKRRSFW